MNATPVSEILKPGEDLKMAAIHWHSAWRASQYPSIDIFWWFGGVFFFLRIRKITIQVFWGQSSGGKKSNTSYTKHNIKPYSVINKSEKTLNLAATFKESN